MATHFQGQKVKGQLAGGGRILWRPPAQLVVSLLSCMSEVDGHEKSLRRPFIRSEVNMHPLFRGLVLQSSTFSHFYWQFCLHIVQFIRLLIYSFLIKISPSINCRNHRRTGRV